VIDVGGAAAWFVSAAAFPVLAVAMAGFIDRPSLPDRVAVRVLVGLIASAAVGMLTCAAAGVLTLLGY
jgi:hypothetical protein